MELRLGCGLSRESPSIRESREVDTRSLVARPCFDFGLVPPVCGPCRDGLNQNLQQGGHFTVNERLTFGDGGIYGSLTYVRGVYALHYVKISWDLGFRLAIKLHAGNQICGQLGLTDA